MKFLSTINHLRTDKRGAILALVIVFAAVTTLVIISGLANYALFENRASNRIADRNQALDIAEAGINYYRWHLAHNLTDFQDGTGKPGPYVHTYTDKNGTVIGYFSLTITAPNVGSTVVTIESTGWTM